jgi:hypothetical protein
MDNMSEDDLLSIGNFDEYEKFIKTFIIRDTVLWKLIFYPYSMPLSDEKATDPEDPYTIFYREKDSSNNTLDSHGIVLFDDKDNTIQNSSNVIVLIHFTSTRAGNSYFLDHHYINFQIICKGEVRKLANGKDRIEAIEDRIDANFNLANVNTIGEIHKISSTKLQLNEENSGRSLTFKCKGMGTKVSSNINYNLRKYGVDLLS